MDAVHGLSFVLHHIVIRADIILRKRSLQPAVELNDLLIGNGVTMLLSKRLIDWCHRLYIKGSLRILKHEIFI